MAKKSFETYRVKLQMRGQHFHTVYANKITAPEYLIMRSIHGEGTIELIEKQGDAVELRLSENGDWLRRTMPVKTLVEKLVSKYGVENFKKVFPGENPILPFTYADAGIDQENNTINIDDDEDWEIIPAPIPDKADKSTMAPLRTNTLTPNKKDDDLIGDKRKS